MSIVLQSSLYAQRDTDTSVAVVSGIADLYNDVFDLQSAEVMSVNSRYNQIDSVSAKLVNGEIVIHYSLKDANLNKEQLGHKYYVKLDLRHGNEPLFIRPDNFYGDIDTLQGTARNRQIAVSGILENFVELKNIVEVKLTIVHFFELSETVICDDGPPKWAIQQKIPFIMGAVGGAGLIAIGAVLEADAQNTYDLYKMEEDVTIGDELYDDANSTHKWGTGLMYAGAGIIAADIIWYIVRKKKYNRRKYLYDTYCNGATVQVNPHFELGNLAGGNATNVGLTFKYTFK